MSLTEHPSVGFHLVPVVNKVDSGSKAKKLTHCAHKAHPQHHSSLLVCPPHNLGLHFFKGSKFVFEISKGFLRNSQELLTLNLSNVVLQGCLHGFIVLLL